MCIGALFRTNGRYREETFGDKVKILKIENILKKYTFIIYIYISPLLGTTGGGNVCNFYINNIDRLSRSSE